MVAIFCLDVLIVIWNSTYIISCSITPGTAQLSDSFPSIIYPLLYQKITMEIKRSFYAGGGGGGGGRGSQYKYVVSPV